MKDRFIVIAAVFASGCAAGDLPQPAESPDRDAVDSTATPASPAVDVPTSIEFTISEVDWGLFDDRASSEPVHATVQLTDGVGSFEAELAPGAFSIRGEHTGAVQFDSTSSDWLESAAGEQTDAPFFNPTRGQFVFHVARVDGQWSVTSERASNGSEFAFDAVDAPTTAGPWFDAAFDDGFDTLSDAIHAHGGPFVTERGVLFIAPVSDDALAPFMEATWNDFVPDASTQLRAIAPGIAARFVHVDGGEQRYTIFDPATQTRSVDRTNRFVAVDGGRLVSVVAPAGVRTVWARFDDGDVFIRTPGSYEVTTRPYPTMYVHDGVASMLDGGFGAVADEVSTMSASFEAITVFIEPPASDFAHTMSTAIDHSYFEHIAKSVVPFVERNFRARMNRKARGIAGAASGGVASFWTAVRHAETFGYAAGISAPLMGTEGLVISELNQLGCQSVVYRIAASAHEPGPLSTTLREALDGLGCDYGYVTDSRHDDWTTFGERFGDALLDFARVHSE